MCEPRRAQKRGQPRGPSSGAAPPLRALCCGADADPAQRRNPEWVKELEIMMRTKTKAEIQSLSSFGFQFLTEVYLPLKLQEGDWI